MSLEGAPGRSDMGAQGPDQEGDWILRAWIASEGFQQMRNGPTLYFRSSVCKSSFYKVFL